MPFKQVPTYENGNWSITDFETKEDFKEFVTGLFKEPGQYEFDETALLFNVEARKFNETGIYCTYPFKSKDFIIYWDGEKAKSRNGVIFKNNNKTWYLTRDYYFWINFLPIYDKESKKFDFPKVWDGQYHMALYELIAELNSKHVAILKKRQYGSSYFHMAKLLNQYWFEEGAILKIGASLKDYINDKGSWKFLNEYRDFLNKHTAWYRDNNPNKVLAWQQKVEETINGRVSARGLKSVISGTSFEKDPTASVGGPVVYFFHEEAGIAPKMHITYEYIRPALQLGMVTTGTFIAAGSVGDLDQCEPLKAMMMDPVGNGIQSVQSNLLDEHKTPGLSGLFIPEQWCMPPYIDKYGNSLVEEALEAIFEERKQWKKDLTPEQYQLRISQKPTNIAEAFASRKVSVFPPHLLAAQLKRIEDKTYPVECVDLIKDQTGKISVKAVNKSPIKEFPISKKTEDKTGVICIYERPIPKAPWGTYYASIDPVGEGKVTTSESLCSIYVYKNATEVIKDDGNGEVTSYIEPETMVASWCGRFDDLQKTHERLELIIEYYNAWTIVENNISLFIQYMISKRKQKYLVPKSMILFLKELGANNNVYQEYGWKNTGNLFKAHLLSYGIQSVQEEISVDTDPSGKVIYTKYGVENIKDPMLLVEMQQYQDGLNVDRLVTYCALMAFMQVQRSNRGIAKRVEVTNDTLENSGNLSNLYRGRSPFNRIGKSNLQGLPGMKRNPFRNLR